MDSASFKEAGHRLVDWIAEYFEHPERYPVLARVRPGEVLEALDALPPEAGTSMDTILADFEQVVVPGLTHWNHPGFFAYFAISASGPGILADFLSSALNQQAMLWRTSPAATELELRTLDWLRQLMGLSTEFEGVIYDTASISTLHALAAAREASVPEVRARGLAGRADLPPVSVYCSDQAHSSVDKAVMLLGFGQEAVRRLPSDDTFRLRADVLARAVADDRRAGRLPLAVVATTGTTSTTSVDPVAELAEVCRQERLWLHVDAAYGGAAALVPGWEWVLDGATEADSLVVNPHKWLFTPFDLSAFYCRHMDRVRAAFSLVPEYLRTNDPGAVQNLMDTGVQLGRRFRALKLWMVLRYFGAEGVRARLAEHMRLARLFASWIDDDPDFARVAPVPMSVVCFRATPATLGGSDEGIDRFNERLLDAVNATGEVFLSHTKLHDRFVLRLAVGNLRTTEEHVARAWTLLREHAHALAASASSDA